MCCSCLPRFLAWDSCTCIRETPCFSSGLEPSIKHILTYLHSYLRTARDFMLSILAFLSLLSKRPLFPRGIRCERPRVMPSGYKHLCRDSAWRA